MHIFWKWLTLQTSKYGVRWLCCLPPSCSQSHPLLSLWVVQPPEGNIFLRHHLINLVTALSSLLLMTVSENTGFPCSRIGIALSLLYTKRRLPVPNQHSFLICSLREQRFHHPTWSPRMVAFSQKKTWLWTRKVGKPESRRPKSQFVSAIHFERNPFRLFSHLKY